MNTVQSNAKKHAICLAGSLVALSCLGSVGCSSTTSPSGPATTPSNKAAAVSALKAVFADKNTSAIDTYFEPTFIRHDPSASADGTAAFKTELSGVLQGITWKYFRAFEQGDLVLVHDEYDGIPSAGSKTVAFDLFRFASGKIAEHWTCREQDPGAYASGHTMVDGPTTADPSANTAASEDLVVTPGKGFVPVVIVGGAFPHAGDFLSPTLVQHNPLIGDGLPAVGAAFSSPPLNTIRLVAIPEALSENDFVFTRSKGTLTLDTLKANSPNNPTVYCDLFRVQDGKIAEHWDVIQMDPNSSDLNDVKANRAGHTLWD